MVKKHIRFYLKQQKISKFLLLNIFSFINKNEGMCCFPSKEETMDVNKETKTPEVHKKTRNNENKQLSIWFDSIIKNNRLIYNGKKYIKDDYQDFFESTINEIINEIIDIFTAIGKDNNKKIIEDNLTTENIKKNSNKTKLLQDMRYFIKVYNQYQNKKRNSSFQIVVEKSKSNCKDVVDLYIDCNDFTHSKEGSLTSTAISIDIKKDIKKQITPYLDDIIENIKLFYQQDISKYENEDNKRSIFNTKYYSIIEEKKNELSSTGVSTTSEKMKQIKSSIYSER